MDLRTNDVDRFTTSAMVNAFVLSFLFGVWGIEYLVSFNGGWDWFWTPLFILVAIDCFRDGLEAYSVKKMVKKLSAR